MPRVSQAAVNVRETKTLPRSTTIVRIRVYVSPTARRSPILRVGQGGTDTCGEDGLKAAGQPYLAVLIADCEGQVLRADPGSCESDDQAGDGVSVTSISHFSGQLGPRPMGTELRRSRALRQ